MSATLLCLVFSVTVVSQTPAPSGSVTPAERQKALLEEINRRNATPEAKAKMAADKARQEAGKSFRDSARAARDSARATAQERDRKEFEHNARLQAEAREEYRRMQPYLLEKQRQELERLSAYERNQALNRIAAANEASARAINYAAATGYNNGFRTTVGGNVIPAFGPAYGPYGFGGIPAVQGTPIITVNPATVYNNLFPVGGLGFP
jgi:hypothetical protein